MLDREEDPFCHDGPHRRTGGSDRLQRGTQGDGGPAFLRLDGSTGGGGGAIITGMARGDGGGGV